MKLMGRLFVARSSQLWLATQKLEAVDGNVRVTTLPEDAIGSYGTLSLPNSQRD